MKKKTGLILSGVTLSALGGIVLLKKYYDKTKEEPKQKEPVFSITKIFYDDGSEKEFVSTIEESKEEVIEDAVEETKEN